jgi:hypothetical protein
MLLSLFPSMKAGELEVCRKVYWRNLTTDGSEVASTQVRTLLSVTPAKFSASVCPDLHPTSIFPWRQVSRTSRFAGAVSKRVVPANQAVSLRFSNENNDAVVGLNFEGHRIPHDFYHQNCCRVFTSPLATNAIEKVHDDRDVD